MSQAGPIDESIISSEFSNNYLGPDLKVPAESKSCPFCGGNDLSLYCETCTFMSDYICIRCNTCHACGPSNGFDAQWEHNFTWNDRARI